MQAFRLTCLLFPLILATLHLTNAEVGPGVADGIRILVAFCRPFHHFTPTAMRFFACYDGVTGREQIVKCQIQVFGANPNTFWGAAKVCHSTNGGSEGFGPYNECIVAEFKKANIDLSNLVAASTHINQCQAKVAGVE